jgi:hypothetical protein
VLPVADGRYLVRAEDGGDGQSVLVVETLAAAPLAGRRRRRPRPVEAGSGPPELPLSRATAVRAGEPFERAEDAEGWLLQALQSEQAVDGLLEDGIALLNRALFAQATAAADPHLREVSPQSAIAVRIGYGSGEEVAAGRYTSAHRVDARETGSRRAHRAEELRPQDRVAAVLGGRERVDACEPLLLRARADLDAGRRREAALQLRIALEALLVELDGALADSGHERDMAELRERRDQAGAAASAALGGELDAEAGRNVAELIEISERVLRRRRVLRGG